MFRRLELSAVSPSHTSFKLQLRDMFCSCEIVVIDLELYKDGRHKKKIIFTWVACTTNRDYTSPQSCMYTCGISDKHAQCYHHPDRIVHSA